MLEWWLQPITITWLKGLTFIRAEFAIYLGVLVLACVFEVLWLKARKKLKQLNAKAILEDVNKGVNEENLSLPLEQGKAFSFPPFRIGGGKH